MPAVRRDRGLASAAVSDGPGEVQTHQPPITGASPVVLPPRPSARPRIVDESSILGLSRVSRGRIGSRLFTGFFVFVFALIVVQMVVALLTY